MRLDSKFEGKLWDYLLQALWGDVMYNSRLRFLQVKIKKDKYIYTYRERERKTCKLNMSVACCTINKKILEPFIRTAVSLHLM